MCNNINQQNELQQLFSQNISLKVNDIFGNDFKIIFILESPEKDEVIASLPAVGSTGLEMAKKLLNIGGKGLGELIDNNIGNAKYFSIINVCNYPLQCREITEYIRISIANSKKPNVRLNNLLKSKNNNKYNRDTDKEKCFGLIKNIFDDFTFRISSQINNDLLFIPCGKFANSFFEKVLLSTDLNLSDDKKNEIYPEWARNIPHPSYNGWSKRKYRNQINTMITSINLVI
ncbi:MAG: hypothetical protein K8S23_08220 [Candidatus Cloacimonetes bacterium]|nr:hypothetical protein [Candidatus Cloacimonadota bacterium]